MAFGSEANGAVTSINTFLGYIMLLEGGIGGVARAALYKNDEQTLSEVMTEIRGFFRHVGYVFILYVLILACSFKAISHVEIFDWVTSFGLVVIISISTFTQYFIGISYSILLQAAQKQYITNIINVAGTVLNAILVVLLTTNGFSLITVKLIGSFVFAMKPIALWIYVKKFFNLRTVRVTGSALKDKWSGLAQHIARARYGIASFGQCFGTDVSRY